ncbi:MAG: tetratricopeptide repeat protein, partial [Persicimonas sp.]
PNMRPYELVHRLLSRVVEIGASRGIHQIERYRSYLTILERMSRLGQSDTQRVDPDWIREAFEDAVVMLHPQKVVLFIENFHHVDGASEEFFCDWYASSRSFHRPLSVAASVPGEVADALSRGEAVARVELEGVLREDVDAFFGDQLGLSDIPDEWLDQVVEYASGQPTYLEELCRNLIDRGILTRLSASDWEIDLDGLERYQLPRSVRESFRRRFTEVSASARECLEVLTLLGRPILWEDLRELIEPENREDEVADRTLRTLRWRHLTRIQLTMEGRHVSLLDDTIAEVVIDLSSPKWERALHRRIGRHIAANWSEGGGDALEAGNHLKLGGLDDEASEMFEIAGDAAWEASEYGRAIDAFERAVELRPEGPEAASTRLKLARSQLAGYEPGPCRETIEEAGDLAGRTGLDWLTYAACCTAADICLSLGDDEGAADWLETLRDSLPAMSRHAEVLQLDATLMARSGALDEAAETFDDCAERARHFGNMSTLAAVLVVRADIHHLLGEVEEAGECFKEARKIARETGEPVLRGRVLCHYGAGLRRAGQHEKALERLTESLEILSDGHRPDDWTEALLQIAMCKCESGHLEEAGRFASDALVFARQLSSEAFIARGAFLLAELSLAEDESRRDGAIREMTAQLERLDDLDADARIVAELAVRRGLAARKAGHEHAERLCAAGHDAARVLGSDLLTSLVDA